MGDLYTEWRRRVRRFQQDAGRILTQTDVKIPASLPRSKPERKYDVVFSFAGEDRDYVEQVAQAVKSAGIDVFYDRNEQVDLWGKNLAESLDKIYSQHAEYCVMFISEAYERKMWTRHERRSAFDRAMMSDKEFILPARFDDTQIDGLHGSVGYIDLREMEPASFADLIVQKINK